LAAVKSFLTTVENRLVKTKVVLIGANKHTHYTRGASNG
jgi:hypothetical protein